MPQAFDFTFGCHDVLSVGGGIGSVGNGVLIAAHAHIIGHQAVMFAVLMDKAGNNTDACQNIFIRILKISDPIKLI